MISLLASSRPWINWHDVDNFFEMWFSPFGAMMLGIVLFFTLPFLPYESMWKMKIPGSVANALITGVWCFAVVFFLDAIHVILNPWCVAFFSLLIGVVSNSIYWYRHR